MKNLLEKIFAYGTLKDPQVQLKVFGRKEKGTPDILEGYKMSSIHLPDSTDQLESGIYPIIIPLANNSVMGRVVEVTPEELKLIDIYETEAYKRIQVTLKSGTKAWVYCQPD